MAGTHGTNRLKTYLWLPGTYDSYTKVLTALNNWTDQNYWELCIGNSVAVKLCGGETSYSIISMTTLSDSFCLIDFSDLRFNRIRHIPRGTFQNLTQLNTLLLNNNQLRRLRNGAFVGLVNLQYLYLYKNQIHLIESNVFDDVPNLEHLYLHFNQIKVISPKLFQGMSNLHRL